MIPDNSFPRIPEIILYQDDFLIAADKPAGMLTIPGGFSPNLPNLKSALEAEFGRLWAVHRLDKETSGIVLFARTPEAHRSINIQFDHHQISKEYRTIVYGTVDWSETDLEQKILVNGDRDHRSIISPRGKPARTSFKLLHRFPCFSYLAAFPHTGLTHQIRAHIAWAGYPILQDALYGKNRMISADKDIIQRTALHACQIQFNHPGSGELMVLKAPLPFDFRQALDRLPDIADHSTPDENELYRAVAWQVRKKKNGR